MAKKEKKIEKAALEETLSQIKQKFGEGAIMKLKEARPVDVDVIPTGSISLDTVLGVGGVPRGRVIEIYGPEGGGKCVKADTIIFSEIGMLPISIFGNLNIPEFQKKEIFLYSEHSYEKTSHFYNGGLKPTIKIKTNYGYELEGTPNHRIRILDKEGNYLFRRLDELQSTDYVAIQRGQNCFGKCVDLSDFEEKVWPKIKLSHNTSKKDFKKFKITKDLAKLMGYMIGDGTCGEKRLNKNNIQITYADRKVESDLRRVCFRLFGEKPKITLDKRTENTKRLVIHNVKARAFLHYAGVGWWDAEQKEIPWSILCSPKNVVANFLKALFESDGSLTKDGHTIEYSSKSERLVKQIQIVLLNFGIISRITSRYNKIYKRYYYYLYIQGQKDKKTFAEEIGFISKNKQRYLENWCKDIRRFQTNIDVIPNLNQKLVKFLTAYQEKIRPTNRKDWKIFYDYLPKTPGYSQLTHDRLKRILKRFSDGQNLPEHQELENLYNLGFFWDKIVVNQKSFAHVLDFTIPSNATFCGNGFINHNTTLALHILAEAQKQGGVGAFVDAEHALDPDWAKIIGVNIENLLISQPDSGEQALQIVETLVRSGEIDVIVVDSVAALVPQAEIAGEMGEFQIGLQARIMSQACLAGETELINPLSGKITTIKEIVERKVPWYTLTYSEKRRKFIISKVIDWLPQGERECFEIKTKDGHSLKLTDDHLVLTLDGWKEVRNLTSKDCLAIPRKIPEPQPKYLGKKLTDEEVKIIAYIIADGNFTTYNLGFSNIDAKIIQDLNNSLLTLNCELSQKKRKGEYTIRKKKNLPLGSYRSPVKELLRELGVFGKKSPKKEIPSKIFKLSNKQLSLFISRLWSCDGHVDFSAKAIIYSSSSLKLIKQLQFLLLRFGIVSRWSQKRPSPNSLYKLIIQGEKNIRVFRKEIGLVGQKNIKLKKLIDREWKSKVMPFQETIPYQLVPVMKQAVYASGHTGQEISYLLEMNNRTSFPEYRPLRRRFSREHLEKIANFIGSKNLLNRAKEEIYWTEIESILSKGKTMVYDLTVKDRPNFVANGVVVHNCRKLAGIISNTKTVVIFLNQTRMKIGQLWGNPETTPGGLALKFYASVRIDLRRIAQIKHGEEIIGSRIKAKIVKNKVAAPFKTAEFDIYYNEGISYLADLLNTAIKNGVIKKTGSWLEFENSKLGQGLEGSKKFLKENPRVVDKIREAILVSGLKQ